MVIIVSNNGTLCPEEILDIVDEMWRKNVNFIHVQKYRALCNGLLNEDYNWEAMVELRNPSIDPEKQRIYYKEFDSNILGPFQIKITDSLIEGHDIIRSFPRTYKDFIYMDTENS
ncbi:hypothetical protein CRE_27747 [Caenorhabditis remanei]|uniref:Uncharacterized protein n=1 Tax=Caenorhabditis remanei TaxID=31234 RepID=E3MXQ2_CAERE|nr:hypothetical protein CRE_27747 [Caenorhabditis remanei]